MGWVRTPSLLRNGCSGLSNAFQNSILSAFLSGLRRAGWISFPITALPDPGDPPPGASTACLSG